MIGEAIVRYVHFVSIMVMFAALVSAHLLLKKEMTRRELKRQTIIDLIYIIGFLITLVAGLHLWFGIGKPSDFYTKNWLFHTKLTLAILAAILSVFPTIFYFRNRKGVNPDELIKVPKPVIMMVRLQLLFLIIVPLLATLMASGIGYFGG